MKKLNRLKINPYKIIKNDQLLQLRGGNSGTFNIVWCDPECCVFIVDCSEEEGKQACNNFCGGYIPAAYISCNDIEQPGCHYSY